MQCKCIYLHSLFVYARNVPETCGAGGDTRIQAPRRRQCSRAVRCKRLPVSPSVRQTAFRDPPCGGLLTASRRAEGNVSKLLSAGDRPHLHTTHQAAFCDMLLIHHKSFASAKQLSHAGDTCILLREEEPVIRQRSETCRAGETVRSPPLRRGKD